jgi:hypothetical protein
MHIRHVPAREVRGHRVTQQGPMFHFTLTCLLRSHSDGQSTNLFESGLNPMKFFLWDIAQHIVPSLSN